MLSEFLAALFSQQRRHRLCALLLQPDHLAGGQPQSCLFNTSPNAIVIYRLFWFGIRFVIRSDNTAGQEPVMCQIPPLLRGAGQAGLLQSPDVVLFPGRHLPGRLLRICP